MFRETTKVFNEKKDKFTEILNGVVKRTVADLERHPGYDYMEAREFSETVVYLFKVSDISEAIRNQCTKKGYNFNEVVDELGGMKANMFRVQSRANVELVGTPKAKLYDYLLNQDLDEVLTDFDMMYTISKLYEPI